MTFTKTVLTAGLLALATAAAPLSAMAAGISDDDMNVGKNAQSSYYQGTESHHQMLQDFQSDVGRGRNGQ